MERIWSTPCWTWRPKVKHRFSQIECTNHAETGCYSSGMFGTQHERMQYQVGVESDLRAVALQHHSGRESTNPCLAVPVQTKAWMIGLH
jgi:hypothetical protein